MDTESLSDGTILFNPLQKGKRSYAVVDKYQHEMASPEVFLSIQDCCIFADNNSNQMIAPDQRHAAFIREELSKTAVKTSMILTDGDSYQSVDLDKLQASGIAYWPSNTQVFLYPVGNPYPLGRLILYNLVTQQSQLITPTFPNLVDGRFWPVPNWYSASVAPKYDPSLSMVIFYENNLEKPDWAISLWDLKTNTEIWRRNLISLAARPWSSEPAWSPDGSRFAIFVPDAGEHKTLELTVVDREGNEKSLLDPAISEKFLWASGIAWSPDGQYLSFYVQEEADVRLLVYDFKREEVWDPAIVEYTHDEFNGNPGGVVWSPDGKQFLANNLLAQARKFAYLVDVEKRQGFDFGYLYGTAVWLAPVE